MESRLSLRKKKDKIVFIQPIVLALYVGLFCARILFIGNTSDWGIACWSLCMICGVCVPLVWVLGLVLIIMLTIKKRYKHCLIILCLNIFISFFYDGIYVFTHSGRKVNRYIPETIQDAKDKGAFICEYSQENRVVLLDSIEITAAEAFVCHHCYYDDDNIVRPAYKMPPHFVTYLKNKEELRNLSVNFYFRGPYYGSSIYNVWKPFIDVDSLTGMPPAEIILRIGQDIRNDDDSLKEIIVDSIRFVRIKE